MNYLLARCMHESTGSQTGAQNLPPPVVSGMSIYPSGDDPMRDWGMMYSSPHAQWDDSEPNNLPFDTINACAPMRAHADFVPNSLYHAGFDGQYLATPRTADPDNPTRQQAMAGPEWQEWGEAIEAEHVNLRRNNVYEEVMEDTLPSWDASRGFASEVVNVLTLLKKKYIDGIFDRFKARFVYDGRMQKMVNAKSENPLDTFAPTARHSTQKLLCAVACKRGANRTTLHSRAYIERIAAKYLARPINQYPQYDTPCSKDILKDYENAVDKRAESMVPRLDLELHQAGKQFFLLFAAVLFACPGTRGFLVAYVVEDQ
jgi:hypothetical protein